MTDENNINLINTSQPSDYTIKNYSLMKDNIKSGTKQSLQNAYTDFKPLNNSNYHDDLLNSIPKYDDNDAIDEEYNDEELEDLDTNKHIGHLNGYILTPEENFNPEDCQKDNVNTYFHIENNQKFNDEHLEKVHNFYIDEVINTNNYNEDSIFMNEKIEQMNQKFANQQRIPLNNLLPNFQIQSQTNFNPNFVVNNVEELNTNMGVNTIYGQNDSQNIQNNNQINNLINNNNEDEINY